MTNADNLLAVVKQMKAYMDAPTTTPGAWPALREAVNRVLDDVAPEPLPYRGVVPSLTQVHSPVREKFVWRVLWDNTLDNLSDRAAIRFYADASHDAVRQWNQFVSAMESVGQ